MQPDRQLAERAERLTARHRPQRRLQRDRGLGGTAQMRAKTPPRKTSKPSAGKSPHAGSSREKVRAHRARMRARGFRLVQLWLPDTRTPEFADQARRASLVIANSPTEQDDQAFIDAVQWWTSAESAG